MFWWEKQKCVSALYIQYTKPICADNGLTQMEYDILMFLHDHPELDTAADIIRVRRLTKSHVSAALKLLRAKGLIHRKENEALGRNIHLRLTEKAANIVEAGKRAQERFLAQLFRGFSAEERSLFTQLFARISENADMGLREAL